MGGGSRSFGLEEEWSKEECGSDWKRVVYEMVDKYEVEKWRVGMRSKQKLRLYRVIKSELCFERYLVSENVDGRREMTRFRGGTNRLRIEMGRHEGLDIGERVCEFCLDGIEDEMHVLLCCGLYDDLRKTID